MGFPPESINSTLELNYEDLGPFLEEENEDLDLGYTSGRRLDEMNIYPILEEKLGESDVLVEVGCGKGYTTENLDSQ